MNDPDGTPVDVVPRRHRTARLWRLTIAIAAAVAIAPQWRMLLAAVGRLARVTPLWLAVALIAELASFVLAAELQRVMLGAARARASRRFFIALAYASTAVSAVLPLGAAFSATYSYRRLVRRDVAPGAVVWVLIASGVVSISTLVALALVSAVLRGLITPLSPVGSSITVLTVVGLVGAALVLARANACTSRLAAATGYFLHVYERARRAVHRQFPRLGERRVDSTMLEGAETVALTRREWALSYVLGASNWVADWMALAAAFLALQLAVPWFALPWAYAASQLIGGLPVLGCIGIAEGSMTLVLLCAGVPAAHAVAVIVIYRLVSFWLTLPVGWVAARNLARDEATVPLRAPVRHAASHAA